MFIMRVKIVFFLFFIIPTVAFSQSKMKVFKLLTDVDHNWLSCSYFYSVELGDTMNISLESCDCDPNVFYYFKKNYACIYFDGSSRYSEPENIRWALKRVNREVILRLEDYRDGVFEFKILNINQYYISLARTY
ncbi:MAG: hypothetical protein A2W93_08595 [Bacteroidetes bacterium GWF2_43_63]|nr:MAG: hypothetical protein A2W94_14755 [Bacteroidetes bacterium GWE2_42_42]OFY55906.1 MAG: hypothetical protein A2W93_08595 [Bacteroidetes bacterium GWF2_43_63]HCB63520.1 hypothetical protein [Bacteroidales bacterium]HCY22928.1 hypothetical protein [Bacteroidales bacterium]